MCVFACVCVCVFVRACIYLQTCAIMRACERACVRMFISTRTQITGIYFIIWMDALLSVQILCLSIVLGAPDHGHHTNGKTCICVRHTI